MAFETIGLKAILQGSSQFLSDLDKAEKAERKLGDTGVDVSKKSDAMGKVLTKVSLAATAGFIGLAAVATKFAMDFERSLDQVGAVAQATDQEMEQLRATALKLGADTAFSAGEAAAAMEELAAGGRSVAQIVGGEALAAVSLAAAGNYGLAESARTIATAMDVWKGTQIETNDVVNRLAGAANASRFGVEDMSAAIAQGGGVAAAVGVTFADFSTGIAAVASSFASGSDAGTSFKTFLLNLDGTTDKAKETIKQYGLEFRNASGELKPMSQIVQELHDKIGTLGEAQQVAALKTIFGNDAYRTAAGLMKLTAVEFEAMSKKMGDTNAADVASQRMGNLSGNIEQLKGSLETLGIQVGSTILPVLAKLSSGATVVANEFGKLDSSTQLFILGSLTLVAALPAMISLMNKAAMAAKAMQAGTASAGLKVSALAGAILAVGVATDIILQKTTGAGLFDRIFGDVARAEGATSAMREFDAVLKAAGPSGDKAALALQFLTKTTEEYVAAGGKALDQQTGWQNALLGSDDRIFGFNVGLSKGKDAYKEFEEQTRASAKALLAANVPLEAQIEIFRDLPPELQKVFDEVTNVRAAYEIYTANLAMNSDEQDRWGDALRVANEKLKESEAALLPAKSALDEYRESIAANEDGVKDFTKALDEMIGRFADANPKVIALQAENAILAETIEDIKDSTTDLTAKQEAQIEAMEDTIAANDKVIKGYTDNQEALEGVRGALVSTIGEDGYGALLAVMDKLKVPQEDQISLAGKIAAAYKLLANDDIPGAIAAFEEMKTSLSPEVWAPIGQAVGPALSEAIKNGMSGPEADAAVAAAVQLGVDIGDGVSQGLNSAANRIAQTGRGIISDTMDAMYQEAQSTSPSKVTIELGQDIGQGLVDGMQAYEDPAKAGGAAIIHAVVVGIEEEVPALTQAISDLGWLVENEGGLSDIIFGSDTSIATDIQQKTFALSQAIQTSGADIQSVVADVDWLVENGGSLADIVFGSDESIATDVQVKTYELAQAIITGMETQQPVVLESVGEMGTALISAYYNAALEAQAFGLGAVLQGFNFASQESAFRKQMTADFGEMGGDVAIAFAKAMVSQTEGSGAALFKVIKELTDEAEKQGVVGATAAGKALMQAFAAAIASGSPELVQEALDMLDAFEATISTGAKGAGKELASAFAEGYQEERDSRNLEEEIGNDGAKLIDSLETAIKDGSPSAINAMSNTANNIVDTINKTFTGGAASSMVAAFMNAINVAITTGGAAAIANLQAILGQINTAAGGGTGSGNTFKPNVISPQSAVVGAGLSPTDINSLANLLKISTDALMSMTPAQLDAAIQESGADLDYISLSGLQALSMTLMGQGAAPGSFGYAKGTPYVPQTGFALVHKGEAIIPASVNATASSAWEGASESPSCCYTIDLRGAQLTGTIEANESMFRRLIYEQFSHQSTRGANLHGVTRR